ncbi:MAG: antibiotic biosynthesis monooxygenase [Ilumatobacter sp.]|uniref:putative quinol monooxygenase n=1 Tax=Ilumatobacter sp. TaxID=1967498 RepID=UPI003C76588A
MFTARVALTCSPEGRATVVERLAEEAAVVPRDFAGCEFYVVSVDANDDHHVLIAEEWTDRVAFDAYQQSDYFAESLATLEDCLAAPPNSAYYDATLVGP